ncbi:unnamed protein product [Rotaria sp. Silwood1]|nr:unnamed protein product [Rotaria sp. Silwood1]CAF4784956.1 unnamed protein product [Rotaria sp. Silwood1]
MLFIIIFLNIFLPVFSHEILKYTIEEKLPINTLITDLSNELNIKSNGFYQIYELLSLNKNLFTINNQTGHLIIKSILDREQMCLKRQCSCNSCEVILQLSIKTKDKIIYKIIEIKIKDRNDHSPNFDKQLMIHVIHIKENVPLGYRIILPSASDPDEGFNSVQSYRLDGPNSDDFDVDFSSYDIPYLIVRSSLDRQRLSSYSLILTASDYGEQPRSNSIQLDIHILNINDSIPTFVQSIYSIDIREDTIIGTTILKVEAISDNNEKIFYELLTESPFIIDRLTGQIQLSKTLDYEREKSYRLIVKAYENFIPTYASIFIRVIDINDNLVLMQIKVEDNITLKQKQNDKNVIFIQENTLVGTTIAHVILNDLDSFANGNPYLQLRTTEPPLPFIYKLIYQNNFQNIKLYSLILNQNLDRESKSTYNNIQLIAYDSGTPTLHTQLNLILNITDINDCIPKIITNSTIYNIYENNPNGYIIDKLNAYDCDIEQNGEIEYHLLNKTDLLIINSKTGQLNLNQSIDFEILNKFQQKNLTTIDLEYHIEVYDHGQPSLSSQTKIILRIHDINDYSPEFEKNHSYNWTYAQSILQPGSILGRIYAYDYDSGLQGLINYSIRSFHPCLTLDITSLGYIYIPYESSILTCSLLSYTFEITASDYDPINSRSTIQLLTINIDLNSINNNNHLLPKLLPLTIQRTILDINTLGKIAFIIDITNLNNYTYQPKIYLNNTNLLSCWNISSTGEISLISHPYASSYILSLYIIDEYTNEYLLMKLQIDICNSSILNSCRQLYVLSDNRMILIYAIGLALIITCICIIIFSLIICLCCGKTKQKSEVLSSTHQHTFLQYHDDYNSEKTESSSDQYKTSSNSTIREDDHDSACIINGHSSSSNSSSSGIQTWYNQKESINQIYPTSSTYYYDLKLAELLRKNQHPPCIHLNELPTIPQSLSTDYGFSSLELSASSSTSTLPNQHIEISVDQSPEKQLNIKSFISSRECVV